MVSFKCKSSVCVQALWLTLKRDPTAEKAIETLDREVNTEQRNTTDKYNGEIQWKYNGEIQWRNTQKFKGGQS